MREPGLHCGERLFRVVPVCAIYLEICFWCGVASKACLLSPVVRCVQCAGLARCKPSVACVSFVSKVLVKGSALLSFV